MPNNFICFGTSSLTECKANEDKYMYRIIGVFPDEIGEQHIKLIKYKQLGSYGWHSSEIEDISWEESDIYKGLNGISGGFYSNLFIGNTTYDYLHDTNWSNKIIDWKWTATNTLTDSNSGLQYLDITTEQMYLHEMNRSTKTSAIGTWTYPVAKIGLMYASDYTLSLGSNALSMTGSSYTNRATLKTGWLHPSNNDTTAWVDEWFMTRYGSGRYGYFYAWCLLDYGHVGTSDLNSGSGIRPVFYLDSNISISGGDGSYSNPYIIK